MSKITPKNLSYDSSLPPFLQRLRSENAGTGDGRHERAIARPKRARNAEDEEDDEPTYVLDEDGAGEGEGRTLTREEYKELVKEKDDGKGDGDGEGDDGKNGDGQDVAEKREADKQNKEKLAAIGGARKRKQGRVIGDEDAEDGGIGAAVAKAAALIGGSGTKIDDKEKGAEKKSEKKKKAKKVKLSFGDEEG